MSHAVGQILHGVCEVIIRSPFLDTAAKK